MISFISHEALQRNQMFDTLTEQTEWFLTDRNVVSRLGGLANELCEINSLAFLPNIRLGRYYVPREYEDNPRAPMLIPTTHAESPVLHAKLSKYCTKNLIQVQPFQDEYTNNDYGIRQSHAELSARMKELAEQQATYGIPPECQAITYGATRENAKKGQWELSRSVILFSIDMPDEVKDEYPYKLAPYLAHEYVHVYDRFYDRALYISEAHEIAGEFRGYHVNSAHLSADDLTRQVTFASTIEFKRLELADPANPFRLTSAHGTFYDNQFGESKA